VNEILAPVRDEPIWLRRELLAAGHSDRDLTLLVKAGHLRRIRRGAFVDSSVYDASDQAGRHRLLARAVAKQAKTRLIVSHSSAVAFHDGPTWGLPLNTTHVTRPDGRAGRAEAGVRQHQGVVLDGDVVVRRGLEVMSETRAALETTTCVPTEVGLVVVADFLHRGLTTINDLRTRYGRMSNHPFTLRTDLVLRLADPRLESVGECRTLFMCYRAGVPAPTPQYELHDHLGDLIARLDFAWPEHKVWLEFDGRQKYVKFLNEGETVVDVVLREKKRESMISELTGWRCIRITWADLDRPAATVARILAMLRGTRAPSVTR
jgi:very-short-patch-repair endonuclease